MEFVKPGTNIDFLAKRKLALTVSTVLVALIWILVPFRLNLGVDFAGGTEIEVKFDESVSATDVRKRIEEAGFVDASVQRFGSEEENSFLVRVERISILTPEQATAVRSGLEQALQPYGVQAIIFDENVGDRIDVRTEKPVPLAALRTAVTAVEGVSLREGEEAVRDLTRGNQPSYQVLTQGLADKVSGTLEQAFGEDKVEIRRVEYVGPQVGEQLRNRGIMAVLLSMGAILLYIAFRFQPKFAPGGIIALFHDLSIVMGYYVVTGAEFNLTSIAVLLTIVGYSINDTIVIFDRVREIESHKTGKPLYDVLNQANNEVLARTIVTSLVTALSLLGLLVFAGGTSLWDFAAAMLVGLVAGTYSTIWIAGPFALWLDKWFQAREAEQKAREARLAAVDQESPPTPPKPRGGKRNRAHAE
ncbi:protein translocase subunit SecF [Vulgatibacter sp.]|uniref:protein translocase subunit SecF n=1 Tax=Vulgatibacter sp. TaxID=1971226 RepID=UPI003562F04D